MFKNLILYRLKPESQFNLALLEEVLATQAFTSCGASQPQSLGWIPPRGIKHGPLVEAIGGQWIIKLQTESKILPAAVVEERVNELAKTIEEQTGRKPGRKQRKDLKEQATLDLLPKAFSKRSAMLAWIDPEGRTLAIDTSSDTLFTAVVGGDVSAYRDQCLGAMWLLGAEWVDLVLWAPDLALIGRDMTVIRIERDDDEINELEADLIAFMRRVDSLEQSLRQFEKVAA